MASINLPNLFGDPSSFLQEFFNNWETQWGIFDQNGDSLTGYGLSLIGAVQSTYSFNYLQENIVSDFPVEQGGFATYNKVQMPATPSVILNLTGNESDRTQFINAIAAAANTTNIYSIITPEIQYISYTIEKYNYRRTASSGTTLFSVELFLKEVRQVQIETTNASNVVIKSPTNAGDSKTQNNGQVNGITPTNKTQNSFNKAIGG